MNQPFASFTLALFVVWIVRFIPTVRRVAAQFSSVRQNQRFSDRWFDERIRKCVAEDQCPQKESLLHTVPEKAVWYTRMLLGKRAGHWAVVLGMSLNLQTRPVTRMLEHYTGRQLV